jgi:uncharacterized protein
MRAAAEFCPDGHSVAVAHAYMWRVIMGREAMTPQERELVSELFDRLAQLESAPRDPDAERTIIEGLQRAPNAVYALVQTALVQDEALKRANDRIRELEAAVGEAPQAPPPGGLLDSMREALTGRGRSGSVPSVRPGQPVPAAPPAAPAYGGPQPQVGYGGGGSFLGTAASAAAGVIGGALLLDGIRSMMGHRSGFGVADPAFGPGHEQGSPWDPSNSELAREAGIDHVGSQESHGRDDDPGSGASDHAAGFYDADNNEIAGDQSDQDVADADYDTGGDFGGDFGDDSGGSSDA